jgi:hypothetical protein
MRKWLVASVLLSSAAAQAQSPAMLARDDRFVLAENAAVVRLALAQNDRPATLANVTTTILVAPQHGTASAVDPGQADYTVAADYSGTDSFTYRICADTVGCDEATVTLLIRPQGEVARTIDATSGVLTLAMGDLRALPSARFAATPLVAPVVRVLAPTVDTTPQSAWDGPEGVAWQLVTLPARTDGLDVERRIYVPAGGLPAGQALLLGVDDDGDGLPEAAETRCTTSASSCELTLTQRDDAPVSWWLLVHNVDAPAQPATITAYDVPMLPGDGSLTATGPGRLARDANFNLWLGWQDETQLSNERRAGFVRVGNETQTIGLFPVVLTQTAALPTRHALPLRPGRDHVVAIGGARIHRGLFVDVPSGATRLRVTSTSAHDVDLALVRMPPQLDSNATTVIAADPAWPVSASDTGTKRYRSAADRWSPGAGMPSSATTARSRARRRCGSNSTARRRRSSAAATTTTSAPVRACSCIRPPTS